MPRTIDHKTLESVSVHELLDELSVSHRPTTNKTDSRNKSVIYELSPTKPWYGLCRGDYVVSQGIVSRLIGIVDRFADGRHPFYLTFACAWCSMSTAAGGAFTYFDHKDVKLYTYDEFLLYRWLMSVPGAELSLSEIWQYGAEWNMHGLQHVMTVQQSRKEFNDVITGKNV